MNPDLTSLGMEKGSQYEIIITTVDCKGNQNASPIGVICMSENSIMNRILKAEELWTI